MAGERVHVSIVSLNIERSKHLERVLPFLREQRGDVVCLQELMAYDIPRIEALIGPKRLFVPLTRHSAEGRPGPMGIGIFSRLPAVAERVAFYAGSADDLLDFDETDIDTKHASESHAVALCAFEKEGETFRIATTHFTWTPDGRVDDYQREDTKKLLGVLEGMGGFVLCGDFNAPRTLDGKPGEIYSILADRYKDNVPSRYETSLDLTLHRAGKTKPHELADKMVDYIFSTPGYEVAGVELIPGISDHCAVVATIRK